METKTFNLTLNIDQLNAVIAGLNELPFKISNALIQEIIRQFNEQTSAPETPTLIDVE